MNKNFIALAVVAALAAGGVWYYKKGDSAGNGANGSAAAAAPAGNAGGNGGGKAGGKGGESGPPTVVNVVAAVKQDVPVVQAANGSVTPLKSVTLHPQTSSIIR
ncbi:MAG TPA: hypothetical protein VIT92_07255, partial [Burkholderiaceae bacterium]